jgi:hypothetical protein
LEASKVHPHDLPWLEHLQKSSYAAGGQTQAQY